MKNKIQSQQNSGVKINESQQYDRIILYFFNIAQMIFINLFK
jgi:hypothetical protein